MERGFCTFCLISPFLHLIPKSTTYSQHVGVFRLHKEIVPSLMLEQYLIPIASPFTRTRGYERISHMWKGIIVAISIAPAEGKPMISLDEAHAVPGRGLAGDRYFLGTGYFSPHHSPSHELTLIEGETIDALNEEYPDLHLQLGDTRRNLVTRGVPLNHLVGHVFQVGAVRLRGMRLCQPCLHIAQLTHHHVLSGLVNRGGLRAQILTDGMIYNGDPVIDLYQEQNADSQVDDDETKVGVFF